MLKPLLAVAAHAALYAIVALPLMLFLGNASHVDGRVPNLGYWTCLWIVAAVDMVLWGSRTLQDALDEISKS